MYVPILKGKEGEFAALEALDAGVRESLIPLIEIPDIPYDYANDRPAKTLEAHVDGIGERLRRCWAGRPLYLDLPWFDEEQLGDGRVAAALVFADCTRFGVIAMPVISRTSTAEYLAAAQAHAVRCGAGLCLRLLVADFEEDVDLGAEVERLLNAVARVSVDSIDLLLDLEDLGGRTESKGDVLVARSVLSMTPRSAAWRRVILAAASFPEDLSDVNAATTVTLPRHEWALWTTLRRRPSPTQRPDMIFGDYGIAHPVPKELDPRTMRMSASIRYTTPDSWLVAKGRNVRQYGFEQYFDLCRALVERPEYSGAAFSWGDGFISECAARRSGPGNATTWRKVGTNHHLTLVALALANQNGV
jgi:hypothetical protein